MKKRKNLALNLLLVLCALAIVAGAVLGAGYFKGWFGPSPDVGQTLTVTEVKGSVLTQREDIAYLTEDTTAIVSGDVVSLAMDAQLSLSWQGGEITCGEDTAFVPQIDQGELTLTLRYGELFLALPEDCAVTVDYAGTRQTYTQTVQWITLREDVYTAQDVTALTQAGETSALSDFALSRAMHCHQLALYQARLAGEWQLRQAQAQEELIQSLAGETAEPAHTETEETQPEQTQPEQAPPQTTQPPTETTAPQQTTAPAEPEETQSTQPTQAPPSTEPEPVCTITIECKTVLNNMSLLTPSLQGTIPSSGYILPATEVTFTPGETVFDVLKRVCSASGIPLEYSYTPMYGSYYIEGINNLYEFSCGKQSGWQYSVNGVFPDYGCSKYTLSDGDTIAWRYTCAYGNDL